MSRPTPVCKRCSRPHFNFVPCESVPLPRPVVPVFRPDGRELRSDSYTFDIQPGNRFYRKEEPDAPEAA